MSVKGFQIDASISDLNDITTTGSPPLAQDDILVYDAVTGKFVHQPHTPPSGVALSYFLDITIVVGSITETVLPAGWSTQYNGIGDFVITHGLNSTAVGYAITVLNVPTGSPLGAPGSKIINPISIANNSTQFKIEDSSGTPINGRVIGMLFK